MAFNRFELLQICGKFFLQTIIFVLIFLCGYFVAFVSLKIFGLVLMVVASSGILYYYFKNLYFVLYDIYKKDIDVFEGKLEYIGFSRIRNILPCGVFVINKKKDREKSGIYHSNVKISAPIGSQVKLFYLKKSKIIVNFEVIK